MRITRIYTAKRLKTGETIELTGPAANHIIHVLRLKLDAPLILFDGTGFDYQAQICEVRQGKVTAKIETKIEGTTESPLNIQLVQAIAKGDKMDFVVQKSVELGVNRITPVFTEHCDVRLSAEKAVARQQRWQTIAINACEQCKRTKIPAIEKPLALTEWLAQEYLPNALIMSAIADSSLTTLPAPIGPLAIIVGPEGGFSSEEINLAKKYGIKPVKLGPRILRTETAAVAALSTMQTKWGDFK